MTDREKVIEGPECCTGEIELCNRDDCPYSDVSVRCRTALELDALALLKAQEPETAEVKWQERHRKSYRQYTGFDSAGEEHTVTVYEESKGQEPYCGKCSAQLAESFTNFCPRCGVKLMMTPIHPTDEQREATPW